MSRKCQHDFIKKEALSLTTFDVLEALNNRYVSPSAVKYIINNLYVLGAYESDFLCIRKSGYIDEIEVKVSRSDFKNDFKHKEKKHQILSGTYFLTEEEKKSYKDVNDIYLKPNRFYYACPDGLLKPEEIPDYAGLIYIEDKYFPKIIKKAPLLHKNKIDLLRLNLEEKFYYAMRKWKNKAETEYVSEIKTLKKELNENKKDERGKKFKYTIAEAHKRLEILEQLLNEKDKTLEEYIQECNLLRRENRNLKNKIKNLE